MIIILIFIYKNKQSKKLLEKPIKNLLKQKIIIFFVPNSHSFDK